MKYTDNIGKFEEINYLDGDLNEEIYWLSDPIFNFINNPETFKTKRSQNELKKTVDYRLNRIRNGLLFSLRNFFPDDFNQLKKDSSLEPNTLPSNNKKTPSPIQLKFVTSLRNFLALEYRYKKLIEIILNSKPHPTAELATTVIALNDDIQKIILDYYILSEAYHQLQKPKLQGQKGGKADKKASAIVAVVEAYKQKARKPSIVKFIDKLLKYTEYEVEPEGKRKEMTKYYNATNPYKLGDYQYYISDNLNRIFFSDMNADKPQWESRSLNTLNNYFYQKKKPE
mgnify:CR=1 FL=1